MTDTATPVEIPEAVPFALRNSYNPDVLTCIANLSSDEVFTPPEFANRMLDTLADGWAASNAGANIWANSTVTFLDPFTKSGVFLREIVKRLVAGLKGEILNLQDRLDHILSKQIFGIGITQLTSLLARRSLYCSKSANGEYSIGKNVFNDEIGHILFERIEHTWTGGTVVETADKKGKAVMKTEGGRCKYCGSPQVNLDRGSEAETYAYAFIHTDDIKARMATLWGEDMQFDVIIGNPPYQIDDKGGHRPVPLYNKFVDRAKALDPRFVVMVTPSRWMAGGLGLSAFRSGMLSDTRLRTLVDYPVASEVFPGVEVKGGVSYFLWDRDHAGSCQFSTVRGGVVHGPIKRRLDQYDILVRDSVGVPILNRVMAKREPTFESIVASVRPFGDKLRSNFRDYKKVKGGQYVVPLLVNEGGIRTEVWTRSEYITANQGIAGQWKVFLPKAGSDGGQRVPNAVIGSPRIGRPGQVSTETYLAIGPFGSEQDVKAAYTYLTTKFARYLISLRKISQDNVPSTFRWLPIPDWSQPLSDDALASRYRVSKAEQAHIAGMVAEWAMSGE